MEQASRDTCARVVIAGGGIAALEALLALRQTASDYVDVRLVAPERELPYRPLSVMEPFSGSPPVKLDIARIVADAGAQFVEDALAGVDTEHRIAHLRSGRQLSYDSLLIAFGAQPRPSLDGALTFAPPHGTTGLRELVEQMQAGHVSSIAFALPRSVRWSLPLYELALMTAARAKNANGTIVSLVTHEKRPLDLFGARTADRMEELLAEAGIQLHAGRMPLAVQTGRLLVAPIGRVPADAVVTLPRLVVPPLPGLRQQRGGFLPVDEHGRVDGAPGVYAAGDVTWYPVKQGGLAAQQADSAAASIAADAGAPVEREPFVPRLRGIMLTGGAPQYLRGETGGAASNGSPRWSGVGKIAGRYLTPYLAGRGLAGIPSRPAA